LNNFYLKDVASTVARALAEDLGDGDVTAALINSAQQAQATIITRQSATIAGAPWVNEVFRQVDPSIDIVWRVTEGQSVLQDTTLFELTGPAASILTAERSALNFLQTLSATATAAHRYASLVEGAKTQILDTRKTLPGMRLAQKYAVLIGGGSNHRIGLFDAFLIKENHIVAAGGIAQAIARARAANPSLKLEIEVESLDELSEAIAAQPDWIMLDNFDDASLEKAVASTPSSIKLEVSGGIESDDDIKRIASLGVDYISIGAMTKHIQATDLSLRMTTTPNK
jgi:nicotinate-nucleotide pyrophosphorylase (carboxylating)